MNENYQDPYLFEEDDEEDDPIDWMGYFMSLWNNKKKIIAISFAFAILSVCIALMQKRQYSLSVVMAPEVQGKAGSGSLGGIASMLGMGNLSLGSSSDALNISLFPEIAGSTPFLEGLLDVTVTPYISPKDVKKGVKPGAPTTVFLHLLGKDKESGFLSQIKTSIFGEKEEDEELVYEYGFSPMQDIALKKISKLIGVDVDKKTGVTTLTVKFDDPLMAMQLADTVLNRLQNKVFEYRTKKERENFEYYSALADSAYEKLVAAQAAYAQSMDNDRNVILQSVSVRKQRLQNEVTLCEQVYTQMAQQRELSRARVQEVKPVFAVIEPPVFPQRPANSRAKTCIVITFFGFFMTCAWYLFGAPLYANLKEQFAARMAEDGADDKA